MSASQRVGTPASIIALPEFVHPLIQNPSVTIRQASSRPAAANALMILEAQAMKIISDYHF